MGFWKQLLRSIAALFAGKAPEVRVPRVESAAAPDPAPDSSGPVASPAPALATLPAAPATGAKSLLDDEAVAKFFAGFGAENPRWNREEWERGSSADQDLTKQTIADAFEQAVWDPVTPMTGTLSAADEAVAAQATEMAERQRAQIGNATVSAFFTPAKWQ